MHFLPSAASRPQGAWGSCPQGRPRAPPLHQLGDPDALQSFWCRAPTAGLQASVSEEPHPCPPPPAWGLGWGRGVERGVGSLTEVPPCAGASGTELMTYTQAPSARPRGRGTGAGDSAERRFYGAASTEGEGVSGRDLAAPQAPPATSCAPNLGFGLRWLRDLPHSHPRAEPDPGPLQSPDPGRTYTCPQAGPLASACLPKKRPAACGPGEVEAALARPP